MEVGVSADSGIGDDCDLPLLANVEDVLVEHYVLILKCDFASQTFVNCRVYLYLTPVREATSNAFKLILDCKDPPVIGFARKPFAARAKFVQDHFHWGLHVSCVEEVEVIKPLNSPRFDPEFIHELRQCSVRPLRYKMERWSISSWKDEVWDAAPRVVCIHYETAKRAASLLWCKDQNEKECCYTYGAWINNRSLFPCQEPPSALATWQAFVTAPRNAEIVTSGDHQSVLDDENGAEKTVYSYTKGKLPMATFALAIGFWKSNDLFGSTFSGLTSSLYFPNELLSEKQVENIGNQLVSVINAARDILGDYPFPRYDIVVLPRNYDSLGLASPNVVFLSQSVVEERAGSMLGVRLAHEVAHGWFGLLIGALDWTEEWLSEGFATYLEDKIFARQTGWTEEYVKNWQEIRAYLRYRNLISELKEIDDELQVLRPNKGEIITSSVKNGMNPDKNFVQVHYLKGYFLLMYLESLAGEKEFLKMLKNYVEIYNGQLVSSQEVFKIFLTTFPHLSCGGRTVQTLCDEWLDNKQLPKDLKDFVPGSTNKLYADVLNQIKCWRSINLTNVRKKLKTECVLETEQELCSDQKTMLLELLLEEKHLSKTTLGKINVFYDLESSNADVRHRWCELIIKHNYEPGLPAIKKFLYEDQGMGVYLYGELMVSETPRLQKLAKQCWAKIKNEACPSAAKVIREMLGVA